MSRRRFFAPVGAIERSAARLPAEELHHLRDVLRLRPGDEVELFDGEGNAYRGVVAGKMPELYVARLEKVETRTESPLEITLGLALIKAERFEWALEKATELGVRAIVPLETRYSEVHLAERKLAPRLARWRRIVLEAAKQSKRSVLPTLASPQPLAAFLAEHPAGATTILLSESARERWDGRLQPRGAARIVIGPEGGWDRDELAAAAAARCRICGLGPRILRAETAAVAAVALAQLRSGDLGTTP
jgi:16S rRNA (uracil1498-N3)-methyltransferase